MGMQEKQKKKKKSPTETEDWTLRKIYFLQNPVQAGHGLSF